MRKKSDKEKIRDKIHAVMRDIRLETEKCCVICGASPPAILQLGHLITRKRASVRFDLSNTHIQCKDCNFKHNKNPEIYTRWWIEKYNLEEYNDLVSRSRMTKKYTTVELQEMLAEFKAILKNMRNDEDTPF